jgi:hypothetical protein
MADQEAQIPTGDVQAAQAVLVADDHSQPNPVESHPSAQAQEPPPQDQEPPPPAQPAPPVVTALHMRACLVFNVTPILFSPATNVLLYSFAGLYCYVPEYYELSFLLSPAIQTCCCKALRACIVM